MEMKRTRLEWTAWATRWLARVLSLVSIAVLALFVVGEPPTPSRVTPAEGLALLFFPVGVVVGMAMAWWREGVGSVVGLASLALFHVVFVVLSGRQPGWWFVIFSLPLFLFAIACAIRLREG